MIQKQLGKLGLKTSCSIGREQRNQVPAKALAFGSDGNPRLPFPFPFVNI